MQNHWIKEKKHKCSILSTFFTIAPFFTFTTIVRLYLSWFCLHFWVYIFYLHHRQAILKKEQIKCPWLILFMQLLSRVFCLLERVKGRQLLSEQNRSLMCLRPGLCCVLSAKSIPPVQDESGLMSPSRWAWRRSVVHLCICNRWAWLGIALSITLFS